MIQKVCIVGAGQLGSRHLQSLATLPYLTSIQVFDPSEKSLGIAKERFNEVANNGFSGKIDFFKNIDQLHEQQDMVIIATNSKERIVALEQIASKCNIKYLILEKFLFDDPYSYERAQEIITNKAIIAWVNCPLRTLDIYKAFKKDIQGQISLSARGNNWGLACNTIHLLDLFAYFTEENDFLINTSLLDKSLYDTKRDGYWEFNGTLTMQTLKGSSFTVQCYPSGPFCRTVDIQSADSKLFLHEHPVYKTYLQKKEDGFNRTEVAFSMPLQSQLTAIFVNEINHSGKCSLPDYATSAHLHLQLLKAFSQHASLIKKEVVTSCPIT